MPNHHPQVARQAPLAAGGLPSPARAIAPYAVILATAVSLAAADVIVQRRAAALAVASVLGASGAALWSWLQRIRLCDRADHFIATGSGTPPSAAAVTARRAELVSARQRRSLARSLRRLVADAQAPPSMSARVPTARRAVVAEAPLVTRVAALLADVDTPVPARGVALAELLVTDCGSPVYRRTAPGHDELHRYLSQILFEIERGG